MSIQPIRVLILAAYPTMQYGLQATVEAGEGAEVAGTVSGFHELPDLAEMPDQDVILADIEWVSEDLDEIGGLEWLPPVVLLAESPDGAIDALAAGFRGALLRDAATDEINIALQAAVQGLAILDPRAVSLLPANTTSEPVGESAVPTEPLSTREREVLELIARGLPNKGIALELGISEHTVKFHVGSILRKLGASSRSEAIARAARAGLIMV